MMALTCRTVGTGRSLPFMILLTALGGCGFKPDAANIGESSQASTVNAMNATNAMNAMNTLLVDGPNVGDLVISDFGATAFSFKDYTPASIDSWCPTTTISDLLPDGTATVLKLPKLSLVANQLEVVVDANGCELTIGIDESGDPNATTGPFPPAFASAATPTASPSPSTTTTANKGCAYPVYPKNLTVYRVLRSPILFCSDKLAWAMFLSPTPVGSRAGLQTYENDVRYECVQMTPGDPANPLNPDPNNPNPQWYCGKGTLGEGISGYAVKQVGTNNSPRPFFAKSLTWSGYTWSKHFDMLKITGAIAERIPAGLQDGYAHDYAWNSNPNDYDWLGNSRATEYVAFLGLKTATNRSGVHVSPYNYHNITASLPFLASELNEGENSDANYSQPDIASLGTMVNQTTALGPEPTYLIDLGMQGPIANCTWNADWRVPSRLTSSRTTPYWSGFTSGFGLNRASTESPRCPTWQQCDNGGASMLVVQLSGDIDRTTASTQLPGVPFYPRVKTNLGHDFRCFSNDEDKSNPGHTHYATCAMQVMCGTPVTVYANHSQVPFITTDTPGSAYNSTASWGNGLCADGRSSCTFTITQDTNLVVSVNPRY